MHTRVAVNLLKLLTRRLFCMVALRFTADERVDIPAERSPAPEAPTARSRARKTSGRNSAPPATAIPQSNVIRLYTSQRKPPPKAGWPPTSPPTRRFPHPPGNTSSGNTSSTEKGNLVAKDSRILHGQERPGDFGRRGHRQAESSYQWRLNAVEASDPSCGLQEA
jgi:hypothetical protein